jgi:hypothetical protein
VWDWTSAASWIGNGSIGSLILISLVRGWLIPRATHLREIGYLERANQAKDATIAEQKQQINLLLGSRDRVGPVS